jgi:hypothetical protein
MNIDHAIIAKNFEKKVNSLIRRITERQLVNKRHSMFGNAISNFFL